MTSSRCHLYDTWIMQRDFSTKITALVWDQTMATPLLAHLHTPSGLGWEGLNFGKVQYPGLHSDLSLQFKRVSPPAQISGKFLNHRTKAVFNCLKRKELSWLHMLVKNRTGSQEIRTTTLFHTIWWTKIIWNWHGKSVCATRLLVPLLLPWVVRRSQCN